MSPALLMALAAMQHEHHQTPAPPQQPTEAAAPVDPHAGHDLSAEARATPAEVTAPPPVPTDHAAERFHAAAEMAGARAVLAQEHGGGRYAMVLADQAEVRSGQGADAAAFESEGWFGSDASRLVLKARGEHVRGEGWENAEIEALYARPIGPYFDIQAGLRQDFKPRGQTYAAFGVEGLAPYWIETKATAFLSDRGDLSARIEAAHDLRLTTRVILQSKVETNLAGTGSDAELGFRLRYEIRREFAPYFGVLRRRTYGDTAQLARAAGERTDHISLVLGVRAWF